MLTPAHLVRLGPGADAVRVQARGFGILLGSFGLRRVVGSLDALVFVRAGRCRAWFVGLHGLARASVSLAAHAHPSIPAVGDSHPPQLPSLRPLPALELQLTVRPPEIP